MKTLTLLSLLALVISPAFAADAAATSTVPAAQLPVADHQVYLNELPESADLMQSATANGLTVKRLDRTADRVVITYGYPDGSTATMGYALLSAAGTADLVAPKAIRERDRAVTVVSNEPEIIYYEPRYRTRYVYRDPLDDFWFPLTLGVGLGWVTSSHHGYYRGGYHGGWRGHGGRHH
jgi:hypothetical protein